MSLPSQRYSSTSGYAVQLLPELVVVWLYLAHNWTHLGLLRTKLNAREGCAKGGIVGGRKKAGYEVKCKRPLP